MGRGLCTIDVERQRGIGFGVFAKGSKVKREAYDIVEDWKKMLKCNLKVDGNLDSI